MKINAFLPQICVSITLPAIILILSGISVQSADQTATWDGTTGNWNDASKWSTLEFPNNGAGGFTYDAVLSGGSVTLGQTIEIENLSINSASATLSHTSGIFTANQGITLTDGTYQLSGGTISGTEINFTGGDFSFSSSSSNIFTDNATFNGDINLDTNSAALRLFSGASFSGNANITGNSARLAIEYTTTLAGKTVNLDGSSARLAIDGVNTLTLGSGTLVRGRGTVGAAVYNSGGTQTLVNDAGIIRADIAGQTLTVSPDDFSNAAGATVEAINGATLSLSAPTWSNLGQINASGGSTVNFNNAWSNAGGTVTVDATSTLNMSGTVATAALGTIDNSAGGTVNVTGTIDNTADTLTLDATTGSWVLSFGTISGGQINLAGGGLNFTSSSGNIFTDNVTFNGDINLDSSSETLRLFSGATFTGDANITGNSARLMIEYTTTLAGKTVNLDGNNARLGIDGVNTLTLGSGTLVRGRGNVGAAVYNSGGTQTLVNDAGIIRADIAGQTLTVSPDDFSNAAGATVEAINGATLSLSAPTWSNLGQINASGGSTVNFNNAWSNAGGTVTVDATSTLNMSGTVATAALGTIDNSAGGTVNVTGTIDNTADTLTLDATTGSWVLSSGTISGGQINLAGGGLNFTSSSGNIFTDNLTFNGDINLDSSSEALRLFSGSTFTGDANITGSSARLMIEHTTTLAGKTVNLDGNNARLGIDGVNTLTLGSGTLVRGRGNVGAAVYNSGGTQTLVNDAGIIRADIAGQTLTVSPDDFSNAAGATVEAINGAILAIDNSTNFVQYTGDALNGGIWKAFADSTLRISTNTGTGFLTNSADITLSGTNSQLVVGESSATLDDRLAENAGAFRILSGRNFSAPASFTNSGILQVGGGTFDAPDMVNSGEIYGYGMIVVRPLNTGTIRAQGGLLMLANGIQGGSGSVVISAGSSLDLSAGATDSSADLLSHSGNLLNLGTNNFLVGADYTNANFGSGNAFAARANVSGSGEIRAVGGTGQSLTGDVTNGGSATPTMAFGNVHVGSSPSLGYQIGNTGGSGASLRGAVQTAANGGNLTDARLEGSGVLAGSFGPIAPGASSGNLSVTFNATGAGPLTGQTLAIVNNFDNVAGQTLSVTGTAYRFASPSDYTPALVDFGNFHVGQAPPTQALTINNLAPNDGYSESLDASIGNATGGVTTNSGSFTGLQPGSGNSTALAVGINTDSAGFKNGTATITLTSNGTGSSGLGLTPLPTQLVIVTGAVYRLGQPSFPQGTVVDFGFVHVDETVQLTVPVTNSAPDDGFSEALDGAFSASTGAITTSGSFNDLAPGSTSNAPTLILDTSTAGPASGTATLDLVSDGAGSSGLGTTALAPQVITASAQVNNYAQPVFSKDSGPATLTGEGTSYTLDFGRRTIGETPPSVTLRLTNDAAAPADTLAGDFTDSTPDFLLTGFTEFSAIGAGQHLTGLLVAMETDTLGAYSQTITLNPLSENPGGYSGALAPVTITLVGEVADIPILDIQRQDPNFILSWPIEEQDWVLREGDNLGGWTDVTEPVIDTDTSHTVTVPQGSGKVFFRLEK